jgi:hypothetical protein
VIDLLVRARAEWKRHHDYALEAFGWGAQLSRFYWIFVRRYAYEICDRCGRRVGAANGSYWCATDSLWGRVEGDEAGVDCMACFARLAVLRGTHVWWLAVEGHAPAGRIAPYPHAVDGGPTIERLNSEPSI